LTAIGGKCRAAAFDTLHGMRSTNHTPRRRSASGIVPSALDDPRWLDVVERNRNADGRFFYSVCTTGVYCRPSCPSRRANPAHVRFHVTPDDAEAAGFRPCRRCRPAEPPLEQRHAALVAAACRTIDVSERPPSLRTLASRAGLSAHHFHRVFRSVTSMTPRDYADAQRASRLRAALETSASVTEAIYAAGFDSSRAFYAAADSTLGMTPRAYRAGGAGLTIVFGTGRCDLGVVLVGRTRRGICAVLLGDDDRGLVDDLRSRFFRADLIEGDDRFLETVQCVVSHVNAPAIASQLPLDLHGTLFQQRVWQALRAIPAGSTLSYGALAARLDAPSSVRAVAQACGANPVAVIVPCHRVVGRDGALTGYRWGVERKRTLLERESR